MPEVKINDLFKFYKSGKAVFKKCLHCEEECDCHYSGTFQVVTDITGGADETRYKTRTITVKSGGGMIVSEESDWKP